MPIAILTSKGQMTIPKAVRNALNLKPSEKVIIVVEGDHAVIKPLRGNILDIGGAVRIADKEKPIDFKKLREDVKKRVNEFLIFLKKNYDGKNIAIVAHKAPQLALDVLIKKMSWKEAFNNDWRQRKAWQPGWEYQIF